MGINPPPIKKINKDSIVHTSPPPPLKKNERSKTYPISQDSKEKTDILDVLTFGIFLSLF